MYSVLLKPLSTLILYAIGAIIGSIIIFFDYPRSFTEERHYRFLYNYQSQLWLLLLIIQTTFWVAVCIPIGRILRRLESFSAARRKKRMYWPILFLGLLLLAGLLYSSSLLSTHCGDYGFPHSSLKTTILSLFGFSIALIAASALLFTGVDLAALENDGDAEQRVSSYINLRRYSLRLLTILGVMTCLATVALGAKRNAILAMGGDVCRPEFSTARVFLHALSWTILLAFTFFPTYAALLRTGRKIVCDLLPMRSPRDDSWSDWYVKQKNLEELLQLSVTESIRAGVAILAPIAGSLISILKG